MSVSINGTGGLTFSDSSTQNTAATGFGFKNRIINGAMMIDQRNAGASVTNSTGIIYTLDRWIVQTVGSTCSIQQVTGSTGNNKALKITGASGNTNTLLSQKIEASNIYDLASQTVTVSFTLYGSGSGSVLVRFLYPTTTDNYTSTTEPVAGTSVSFTTTATTYTVTRTLDANANKGLWVVIERGATGSGVTWSVENFQLEKGSTATSFDYRPYGTELALCQRYLPAFTGINNWFGTGIGNTSTQAYCTAPFPVTTRVAPTGVTVSSASHFNVTDYISLAAAATSITLNTSGTSSALLIINTASGVTVARPTTLVSTSASANLYFTGCEL
jgi:hypothetical protein